VEEVYPQAPALGGDGRYMPKYQEKATVIAAKASRHETEGEPDTPPSPNGVRRKEKQRKVRKISKLKVR